MLVVAYSRVDVRSHEGHPSSGLDSNVTAAVETFAARQKPHEQSQPANQPQTCLVQRSSHDGTSGPPTPRLIVTRTEESERGATDVMLKRPCTSDESVKDWREVHKHGVAPRVGNLSAFTERRS